MVESSLGKAHHIISTSLQACSNYLLSSPIKFEIGHCKVDKLLTIFGELSCLSFEVDERV